MPATRIFDDANEKPDGSRYEMVAWTIPRSEDYPEGVTYSFQYMDADGNTLLRFDNAPSTLTPAGITVTPPTAKSRPWSTPASAISWPSSTTR